MTFKLIASGNNQGRVSVANLFGSLSEKKKNEGFGSLSRTLLRNLRGKGLLSFTAVSRDGVEGV